MSGLSHGAAYAAKLAVYEALSPRFGDFSGTDADRAVDATLDGLRTVGYTVVAPAPAEEMAEVGDVYDIGASEPSGVLGVESLTWADYGWGGGPELADPLDDLSDVDDVTLLQFGRTARGEWKFYVGGKTYAAWAEVVRRFGPVRVTMIDQEARDV